MKHYIQVVADNTNCTNAQLENMASNAGYEASRKLRDLWEDQDNAKAQFSTIKLNITIEIEAE